MCVNLPASIVARLYVLLAGGGAVLGPSSAVVHGSVAGNVLSSRPILREACVRDGLLRSFFFALCFTRSSALAPMSCLLPAQPLAPGYVGRYLCKRDRHARQKSNSRSVPMRWGRRGVLEGRAARAALCSTRLDHLSSWNRLVAARVHACMPCWLVVWLSVRIRRGRTLWVDNRGQEEGGETLRGRGKLGVITALTGQAKPMQSTIHAEAFARM